MVFREHLCNQDKIIALSDTIVRPSIDSSRNYLYCISYLTYLIVVEKIMILVETLMYFHFSDRKSQYYRIFKDFDEHLDFSQKTILLS